MSPSPPITRVVSVLNFLGGHAHQAFTLTEIAKSLRISGATCFNLLGALVETGYVYRTAAKTYVIGPAISRLARESLALEGLMQVVRPEMRLLADKFDVVCSAAFLHGQDVIVKERAAAVSHISWNVPEPPPQRTVAPLGTVFFAGSSNAAYEQWLDAAPSPLSPEERRDMLETLEFLRTHGYTFGVRNVPIDSPEHALALRRRQDMTSYRSPALDPNSDYNLAFLSAPVFGHDGAVACIINLLGFNQSLQGEAIAIMGERLRSACDRISSFIAGRPILDHSDLSLEN